MSKRLPPRPGECIDRSRPLRFRFEGQEYSGFAGDTISTALWLAFTVVVRRRESFMLPVVFEKSTSTSDRLSSGRCLRLSGG